MLKAERLGGEMNWTKAIGVAMTVAAGMGIPAGAQQTAPPQGAVQQQISHRVIIVSLEDRKLALLEDGAVRKVYTVAVGKASSPSPVGTFTIERRVANPVYQDEGKTVPPGPANPVGTRWMGLSVKGYGIHGTNAPKSIGKAASHGCIRMGKADLEELFAQVRVGDTVELIGERNEETIALFGAPEVPATAAQSTVLALASVPAPVAGMATAGGSR